MLKEADELEARAHAEAEALRRHADEMEYDAAKAAAAMRLSVGVRSLPSPRMPSSSPAGPDGVSPIRQRRFTRPQLPAQAPDGDGVLSGISVSVGGQVRVPSSSLDLHVRDSTYHLLRGTKLMPVFRKLTLYSSNWRPPMITFYCDFARR